MGIRTVLEVRHALEKYDANTFNPVALFGKGKHWPQVGVQGGRLASFASAWEILSSVLSLSSLASQIFSLFLSNSLLLSQLAKSEREGRTWRRSRKSHLTLAIAQTEWWQETIQACHVLHHPFPAAQTCYSSTFLIEESSIQEQLKKLRSYDPFNAPGLYHHVKQTQHFQLLGSFICF